MQTSLEGFVEYQDAYTSNILLDIIVNNEKIGSIKVAR